MENLIPKQKPILNQTSSFNSKSKIFDLEERTSRFGELIIELVQKIPKTEINRVFTNQIIRSGTSVGANYMEADGTRTRKDLEHKLTICRKEAKETKYWLRIIRTSNPTQESLCNHLIQEAYELILIFSSIIQKT